MQISLKFHIIKKSQIPKCLVKAIWKGNRNIVVVVFSQWASSNFNFLGSKNAKSKIKWKSTFIVGSKCENTTGYSHQLHYGLQQNPYWSEWKPLCGWPLRSKEGLLGFGTRNPNPYALDNERKLAAWCKAMVLWEERNVFRVQQEERVHLSLSPWCILEPWQAFPSSARGHRDRKGLVRGGVAFKRM